MSDTFEIAKVIADEDDIEIPLVTAFIEFTRTGTTKSRYSTKKIVTQHYEERVLVATEGKLKDERRTYNFERQLNVNCHLNKIVLKFKRFEIIIVRDTYFKVGDTLKFSHEFSFKEKQI